MLARAGQFRAARKAPPADRTVGVSLLRLHPGSTRYKTALLSLRHKDVLTDIAGVGTDATTSSSLSTCLRAAGNCGYVAAGALPVARGKRAPSGVAVEGLATRVTRRRRVFRELVASSLDEDSRSVVRRVRLSRVAGVTWAARPTIPGSNAFLFAGWENSGAGHAPQTQRRASATLRPARFAQPRTPEPAPPSAAC